MHDGYMYFGLQAVRYVIAAQCHLLTLLRLFRLFALVLSIESHGSVTRISSIPTWRVIQQNRKSSKPVSLAKQIYNSGVEKVMYPNMYVPHQCLDAEKGHY